MGSMVCGSTAVVVVCSTERTGDRLQVRAGESACGSNTTLGLCLES